MPTEWLVDIARKGEVSRLPALSFLMRHSKTGDTIIFDLGIRKDWENLPPVYAKIMAQMGFHVDVPKGAIDSLAEGGAAPEDITYVCPSHLHFDHVGDTRPFTNATFLVGGGARAMLADPYPQNPNSPFAADLLPAGRTRFLDSDSWSSLGPFAHALDFFGDGSLYLVDAGTGHCDGHLNMLVRTSPDGGWVYLAGDSAHDRRLLTGEARIGRSEVLGCAHRDVVKAEAHIAGIKALMDAEPRVEVILAHDTVWYEANKNKGVLWPGKLRSR